MAITSNNILTLESNKYKIKIDNFEGPLDLLCYLIDANKMDIYDIRINEITDQYVAYINAMQELDLEVTSEFLIMASNLLYLKSKKLLPKTEDDETELSEEELIQRIIQYKQYKEITKTLNEMYQENNRVFFGVPQIIELPKQDLEEKHNLEELVEYYKDIIMKSSMRVNKNAQNIKKIALNERYSIGDSIKKMFRALIRNKHFVFNKLFSSNKYNKEEIITAFSGLLEMSRRNKVSTEQKKLFGDINVDKVHKNKKSKK